jgi:hypothetical protein
MSFNSKLATPFKMISIKIVASDLELQPKNLQNFEGM